MCGKNEHPKRELVLLLLRGLFALLRLLCALYYLVYIHMAVFPLKVNSTFSNKFPFSNAAATRSLSLSCLFTCVSDACEPSETFICFARRVRMRRKTTVLLERESRLGQCCRRRRTRMMMCKTLRKGREKRSRSIRMKWRLFEANEARSDNNTIYKLVSYIDFKPLR